MEPSQANVRSIHALERLRAAMVQCLDELKTALGEAESEVGKAATWLSTDRIPHWRRRVQRLAEEVNSARGALFRKETVTSSKDSKPSVVDERKALERAKAMAADAEERGRRSRMWSNALPREQAIFKRGIAAMAAMVERDLPMGIHALGRMIEALERYHRDAMPDLRGLIDAAPGPAAPAADMRRAGGDEAGSPHSATQGDAGQGSEATP
ncbi:MAG: hypothetical protein ACKOGH_13875 [Alphaproteobacteria bacterium]